MSSPALIAEAKQEDSNDAARYAKLLRRVHQ